MPFARKIEYLASQEAFVALIEITHRKGASPKKLVLYRYSGESFEMIYLPVGDKEKVVSRFFSIACAIEAVKQWEKTTDWLCAVAVGGSYQVCPKGTFVKVGRPNRCKDRRSRCRFVWRFGELGHLMLKERAALEQAKDGLERCTYEERRAVEEEIDKTNRRIAGLMEEMKFVRAKTLAKKA